MNRQEKSQIIQSLVKSLQESDGAFLVKCQGLTVAQLFALRKKLREQGGSLHVAKVTLMKRAVKEVPAVDGITPMIGEQIALVFAEKNSPAVAKVLCEYAADHAVMGLVGGYFESRVLDQNGLKVIGSLPSREVLLAQLCGVLNAPIAKLAYVLQEIANKKASGEVGAQQEG